MKCCYRKAGQEKLRIKNLPVEMHTLWFFVVSISEIEICSVILTPDEKSFQCRQLEVKVKYYLGKASFPDNDTSKKYY